MCPRSPPRGAQLHPPRTSSRRDTGSHTTERRSQVGCAGVRAIVHQEQVGGCGQPATVCVLQPSPPCRAPELWHLEAVAGRWWEPRLWLQRLCMKKPYGGPWVVCAFLGSEQ